MGRFFFVALVSFTCALSAQNTPAASNGKSIALYVQVTDKSGAPVSGLTQQDFTLIDNKHPQNITGFQAIEGAASDENSSAQVVLVIDSVDTPASAVSVERDDIRKFLLRDGGTLTHPLSFVVVTETGTRISPDASRDGKALLGQFDQLATGIRSARSFDTYQAQERLGIAMKAVATIADHLQTKPGRKLVIWLSPGWPLMSGATVKFSPQGHEMFFQEIARQSATIRKAGITMYAVDPLGLQDAGSRRVNAYKGYLKPVKSAPDAEPANLALQVLSIQSGGRVLNSSNDLDKEIADCVADANGYYRLSFDPERGTKAGEYHELTVKVNKPDMIVRTNAGYYAGTE